jgi:hypothetical protein
MLSSSIVLPIFMEVITGVIGFGERPKSRWSADKRPKLMKKLINIIPGDCLTCLKRSISFCRDRNLLAHGLWWEFNVDMITVRSWVEWPKQAQHRTFTVAEIQDTRLRRSTILR